MAERRPPTVWNNRVVRAIGAWTALEPVNDPYERDDLSSERPQVARALIEAWEAYASEVGVVTSE
ncbi:MAG: hypothetical protein OEM78_12325 [Gammaproteobacteria bacterium]|nr:hypothetical protein [Gammaproteobacteria bacterium]